MVDAHVHVFPEEMARKRTLYLDRDARFHALYASPHARMATAGEVLENMDEDGVAVSVLVGFPFADQGLCRLVNDCLVEAVRDNPGRFAGLACVATEAPGAVAELERCLDAGLAGCGELAPHVGDGHGPGPADGSGMAAIAGCLKERGLPLLVHASEPVGHAYPGKGRFTPEACLDLAQAYPGLTVVFAHMGGGLFLYESMPEVREVLADVYYDTAAVPYLYDPTIYAAALSTAGPQKLIFGSDFPLLSPARYREGFGRLPLPLREAVEGGNARKVYRL